MILLDNRNSAATHKGYSYYMGQKRDIGKAYNWVVITDPASNGCSGEFFSTKKEAIKFIKDNK